MTARGHEAEGDSGCGAATDTVPSYLHAAVEAETCEEGQERLALRRVPAGSAGAGYVEGKNIAIEYRFE
jgi:hypothetical protein